MDPVIHTIFQVQDECTLTLKELLRVLEQERTSLVRLEMNEIAENTRLKENLNHQLIQKVKRLKKLVEGHFETLNDFEEKMDESTLLEWRTKRDEFWKMRESVRNICEINQNFLKSSLRNLSALSDHLRRLFGGEPLYTQKGTKVDKATQGRVLEAQY